MVAASILAVNKMARVLVALMVVFGAIRADSALADDQALQGAASEVVALVKAVQNTYNHYHNGSKELSEYALTTGVVKLYSETLEQLLTAPGLEGNREDNAFLLAQLKGAIEGLKELA